MKKVNRFEYFFAQAIQALMAQKKFDLDNPEWVVRTANGQPGYYECLVTEAHYLADRMERLAEERRNENK